MPPCSPVHCEVSDAGEPIVSGTLRACQHHRAGWGQRRSLGLDDHLPAWPWHTVAAGQRFRPSSMRGSRKFETPGDCGRGEVHGRPAALWAGAAVTAGRPRRWRAGPGEQGWFREPVNVAAASDHAAARRGGTPPSARGCGRRGRLPNLTASEYCLAGWHFLLTSYPHVLRAIGGTRKRRTKNETLFCCA